MLTAAQRSFLTLDPAEPQRWVYSDENRDRIDDLVAAGILTAAQGELRFALPPSVRLIFADGRTIPIAGRLLSLYKMTAFGNQEMRHRERMLASN